MRNKILAARFLHRIGHPSKVALHFFRYGQIYESLRVRMSALGRLLPIVLDACGTDRSRQLPPQRRPSPTRTSPALRQGIAVVGV